MKGQISIFDVCIDNLILKPGDYVAENQLREELTFDEMAEMVGKSIAFDCSTESHNCYQVVVVEKIHIYEDGSRRLIYYHGKKQRGLVNEMYFNKQLRFPARAWLLN